MFNSEQKKIIKKALEVYASDLYSRMENVTDKNDKEKYNKEIEKIDDIILLVIKWRFCHKLTCYKPL